MAETFETRRELEVGKSADEVWEWLSNVGNAMTINQFHVGIDCDPADVKNPKVGLDVPIVHEIFGARHIRLGKITKFEDYEIAWGERLPDPNAMDRFPHSEGWTVESIGKGRCLVRNRLRGRPLPDQRSDREGAVGRDDPVGARQRPARPGAGGRRRRTQTTGRDAAARDDLASALTREGNRRPAGGGVLRSGQPLSAAGSTISV